MNTDIKDIVGGAADVITFRDKAGNKYTIPERIPSEISLIVVDMWDDLAPFIRIMGVRGKARLDAIKALGEEQGKDPREILRKLDDTSREILSYLISDKYPNVDAEWIKENIPDEQYHILAMEILQKATSFFLSRMTNSDHFQKAAELLTEQTERLGLG